MTTDLSVVAPETEAEPERPDEQLRQILEGHLNGARQELAFARYLGHLEASEVPGLTLKDVYGDGWKRGNPTKPATLWDVAFGHEKDEKKRPDHGERLEVRTAGLEAQVAELEALLETENARAKAHAEWAQGAGRDEIAKVTNPAELQLIVGAQEASIREMEREMDDLRATVGRLCEATGLAAVEEAPGAEAAAA